MTAGGTGRAAAERRRLVLRRFGRIIRTSGAGVARVAGHALTDRGAPGPSTRWTVADVVSATVEEMGPAAVKIGQALGGRPDVVGRRLAAALSRLQSQNQALPWADIEPVFVRALPERVRSRFRTISPHPVAVGSIAQIHAATLTTGQSVCVKLKRPGVDAELHADLAVLARGARLVGRLPGLRGLAVEESIAEIRHSLAGQLDFVREADISGEVGRWLADRGHPVRVPRTLPDLCSHQIITMEHVEGLRGIASVPAPAARERLAVTALEAFYALTFDLGLVHADLHPGNIQVDAGGRLVLLDFGMTHRLSEPAKVALRQLFLAMAFNDGHTVADIVLRTASAVGSARDPSEFRAAVAELVGTAFAQRISDFEVVGFVAAMFGLQRRYCIRGTSDFTAALAALAVLEGVLRSCAPEADFQLPAALAVMRADGSSLSPPRRRAVFASLESDVRSRDGAG